MDWLRDQTNREMYRYQPRGVHAIRNLYDILPDSPHQDSTAWVTGKAMWVSWDEVPEDVIPNLEYPTSPLLRPEPTDTTSQA
jgi:hypothetical protein